MNLLSILGLGLILGVRHATDADHVVAVTTIVAKQKHLRGASIIGALWGIGHTITIFIVGVAIIFFHVVIPAHLGLAFEFLVALALIILGLLNLTGVLQRIVDHFRSPGTLHAHVHFHGSPHMHVHEHTEEPIGELGKKETIATFIRRFGVFQLIRPFIVGLVHGLAGSAAIALLILGSIPNATVAILYLLVFGVGTIIGMMLITTLISLPLLSSVKKYKALDRYITIASGLLSLGFGLYLAYQIGVIDGLFSTNPTWNPQ